MKYLILLSFLSVAGLSACSSGDNGPHKLEQCGHDWKLLSLDRKAQEKTDLGTSDPNLAAGRYDSSATTLYYWDKAADIKMQISAKPNLKTGENEYNIACLSGSGINAKMDDMSLSVPYVSNMVVDANGKTLLSTRSLNVTLSNVPGQPLVKIKSDEVSNDVQGSIKNTYDQYDNKVHKLFKVSAKAYETRTQLKSEAPGKTSEATLDVRVAVSYAKDRPLPDDPETPETPVAPEQ